MNERYYAGGFLLPQVEEFMGLEGERPAGVRLDVGNRGSEEFGIARRIAAIAGLQGIDFRRDAVVWLHRLPAINDFQFIDGLQTQRRIGAKIEFRGAGVPIDGKSVGGGYGAVGFDLYEFAGAVQALHERGRELEHRLAAGNDHMTRRVRGNRLHNVLLREFAESAMVGVAEAAPQVAPRQANENGGRAGEVPFALQRIENFVYSHRASSSPPAESAT